jgi:membrane protease YdiL (CAAX protease family)
MGLQQYLNEHPLSGAFIFWIVFISVTIISGTIRFVQNASPIAQISSAYSVLMVVGILLIVRLRWWRETGFTTIGKRDDLLLYILPLIVAFLSVPSGVKVNDPSTLALIAGFTFLVGFTEETFFRGLILNTLRPLGPMRAASISALLFGLPHLLNAISGVWDPMFTLVDSLAAIGIGVTFASLFIRTKTIWPLIGLHALIDFTALITQGGLQCRHSQGLFFL